MLNGRTIDQNILTKETDFFQNFQLEENEHRKFAVKRLIQVILEDSNMYSFKIVLKFLTQKGCNPISLVRTYVDQQFDSYFFLARVFF